VTLNRPTALLACGALVVATACAPPFAIRRNVLGARHQAATNVITTGDLSRRTHNVLYDRDLVRRYADDPAGALAELHADLVAGRLRPENVSALAEVAFHHAVHGGGQPYYLASALYAWAYLFPGDPGAVPDRFDHRVRLACEVYNRGLAEGLEKDGKVDLRAGTYRLPFGTLEVALDPATLVWSDHQLYDFFPLADIEVTGFPTYYRWPGLGAPLAARVVPQEGGEADLLAPRARVPVTAVLRPSDLTRQLRDGTVHAALEVYPGYGDTRIKVDQLDVPLEAEPTAALGVMLAETAVWKQELTNFLRGAGLIAKQSRLVSTRPYRPGLVPVVLVHGTGSSAIRWAELYNELDNDPRIHDQYQFWFFSYETGNPIIYSSSLLREALEQAVTKLDPEGRDPALRRMIVMGHSQGGLLTKMTVVESGDAFWRNLSREPLDEIEVSDETRDLLRRVMFVHPLPFVRRVVFVATPHHGSYIAGKWLAHQFARLISAPLAVTSVMTSLATFDRNALVVQGIRGAPTAVDNMTPGNPFVKTLARLPIAPDVVANSIIPVDAAPPPQGKNDGVVEYDSAHIDGVESELVVRSPHSCQSNPHTMAEVRRILLKHLVEP
jgi:triacylglycerol esterase/lipase EstA (alpha/beta hydrolase family)